MKHLRLFIFLSLVCMTLPLFAGEIKIDTDFPGGNIKVISIDGDNVVLEQDLRDTAGAWFYWSFRIRGAEGRTLHFTLGAPGPAVRNGSTEIHVVGVRGPAVSNDGINWHWLSDKTGFSTTKFSYTFGADEKEIYFSQCINYTEKNLHLFLAKYKDNPLLKVETLCKSEKGRNVELLRIGKNKNAPFKVFLSSRHHCGETMGTYAMEGIIATVLADTEDGQWLREHCDFFMVPLVDKDGVEDGDQGKHRKPHDHNRDYILRKYYAVKAITEQVPKWAENKPLFFLDLHCPGQRGGMENESFYFVGQDGEKITKSLQRYGEILEKERQGTIPFTTARNILPFGKSWNTAASFHRNEQWQSCSYWGATLPDTVFVSSTDIPFANAEGVVVDADSARKLGNDLARAIRVYLETLE
ncbi:hypothetical protein FACS1894189_6440 [Planctomycetales bacterium]|nr:hypothetical protein FACS1894189_6440 [Planctomycetales bacterium]